MIKSDPKSILYFIWNYFDVVKDLFDAQSNEGLIRKETLQSVLGKHEKDIKHQLIEYKIIRQVNDDYEFRDVYFKLIEFILLEFRPLLPEEIEKFGKAISELFKKIKTGGTHDKIILLERIKALSVQIKEFSESVERNSIRLLNETRELKSNVYKIDYREKIQRASFWIQYYINPLNKILDVNQTKSVTNVLLTISNFANVRRLHFEDENIRQSFEKLYYLLVQTNDDLLRQSKILTNELLPLIERLRTESMIITGWIEFLKNPYRLVTPKLLKTDRDSPYSNKIYLNTKEYFEQFIVSADAVIEDEGIPEQRWMYNKAHYRSKLVDNLPLDNFFDWCTKQLKLEKNEVSTEKVFALTGLLFDDEFEVNFGEKSEFVKIKTQTSTLNVPKLNVKRNNNNGVS